MVTEYFYIYSIEKIKKIFPVIKEPDTGHYASEESCKCGWTPGMANHADSIHPILEEDPATGCYRMKDIPYRWDPLLGIVLKVDSEPKPGYHYLDAVENWRNGAIEYKISLFKSELSVGPILNMPIEQPKSLIKKLLVRR